MLFLVALPLEVAPANHLRTPGYLIDGAHLVYGIISMVEIDSGLGLLPS